MTDADVIAIEIALIPVLCMIMLAVKAEHSTKTVERGNLRSLKEILKRVRDDSK